MFGFLVAPVACAWPAMPGVPAVHELSITQSVVEACTEHAAGARVLKVTLEIGRLSAVVPDAVRFCFDVCAKDTPLEGAELEIIETPGQARCCACGRLLEMQDLLTRCACGSVELEVLSGQEMIIKQMEVM